MLRAEAEDLVALVRLVAHAVPKDDAVAVGGRQQPRQHRERRRFPRAIMAEEARDLPWVALHVEAAHGDLLGGVLGGGARLVILDAQPADLDAHTTAGHLGHDRLVRGRVVVRHVLRQVAAWREATGGRPVARREEEVKR